MLDQPDPLQLNRQLQRPWKGSERRPLSGRELFRGEVGQPWRVNPPPHATDGQMSSRKQGLQGCLPLPAPASPPPPPQN